jgi:hypothetical protein
MKLTSAGPATTRRTFLARVPLAVWICVAVVAAHGLFFWLVWNKHFLPKVPPAPVAPTPANFTVLETRRVDPRTGATVIERQFTLSTSLASPPPAPAASKAP